MSRSFYDCPVCDAPIQHFSDYMEHILLTESDTCPNGCYLSWFDTGYSVLEVGDHRWSWGYRTKHGSPTRTGEDNAVILARAKLRDGGSFNILEPQEGRP